MIRLIFCDVDGTLVQDNDQGEYTISVENLQEINKTMNSGVHFALATGRPADFVPRTYGRQFSFDTVAYSGAYVTASQKLIYESVFTLEEARHIHALLENQPAELLCITNQNDYCFAERKQEYIDEFSDPDNVPDHREILPWTLSELTRRKPEQTFVSLVILAHQPEILKQLAEQAARLGYDPVMPRHDGISVMKPGVNKASGIQKIAALNHVPLYEIAVLGDSINDLEMFDLIEESYAMEKSNPEILARAKYIVRDVAEALRRIQEKNREEQEMSKC